MESLGDFRRYLSSIEPDASHVAKAKKAHEDLREFLRNHEEVGQALLDSFLSGSYARRVAINDIKDVDVICVLDIDTPKTEPSVLQAWLTAALREKYSDVRMQGRSIRVIASNRVHLDVVPGAALISSDGPLWIPDREAQEWVTTHPKGQIAFARSRNDQTDGYYVQVVKLMKAWRDISLAQRAHPKSYVLETLVAEALGSWPPSSHAAAVVSVLDGVLNRYRAWVGTGKVPSIVDPGYPTTNVAKRWEPAEFEAFLDGVANASIIARDALESDDPEFSRVLWGKLFGPEFGS